MILREHVELAPLTTLGVGGAARYLVEATTADEVREAVEWARARSLPLFVLGGGSNLVVADDGFPGLVLKLAIRSIDEERDESKVVFSVGAGEDWDGFVAHAVASDCAGIECLSGIPGTVGGTPVQNVGAYGQEVAQTICSVEALELATGEVRTFRNDECEFQYRSSRFNTRERGLWIILRVAFSLQPHGRPRLAYADLVQFFAGREPTLAEVRQAVIEIRRSKGMVIVNGDEDCRSAGSFFKNPVLVGEDYDDLQLRAAERGLLVPTYPALASQQKVPAAWLVEKAGFHKGYTRGRAGISRKHALAIINRGGATAAEVIGLKNAIQLGVRDQFGIDLQPEPVFLGFDFF